MSVRTQITLDDEQYRKLRAMAEDSGLSMSELIRRALDRTYAKRGAEAVRASFGAWKGRKFDGESYVESMRRGLDRRLRSVSGGGR